MSEQEIHRIAVHVAFVNKVNFACHHSTFALLRELQIENLNPEQDLSDLRVTLEATPAFLKSKTWTLDCLVAGGRIAIQDRDLELDGAFLFSLSESLQGEVRVRVSSQTECLSETVLDVEVLARNEWGGTDFMPELLAAFCVPNDPVVGAVLGEARRVLRKAGKDDVMDGYRAQSRERAWLLASAIYSAIAKLQVGYALPPVSFEHNGQKIRLPEQVAESRVATCLEITLLFAAALEQAGLNPLLVLTEGHALVGLWLQSEELSSIVVDEADILRQRIPLKELILIDTTLLTSHPVVPFSSAVKIGIKAISLQQDDQFVAAIDVRRARSHCINPVCLRPESLNTV
ncbi:MAG: DNA helicase, partial [Marinobacterium sp.]